VTGPSARHWAGYAWFMSFGTVFPLLIFLAGYVVHVTLVGAPIARQLYSVGIWTATLGQPPPKRRKEEAKPEPEEQADKKPFVERIRPYTPTVKLERRGKPVPFLLRVLWFVVFGCWLGAVWVVLSWSVFLAPYPFIQTVETLLGELPSVMTLAYPKREDATSAPQ
jgi:uncharacterized membrane protein YccF (DUF307 family)